MRHPTNQQKKRFGYTVFALLLLATTLSPAFAQKTSGKPITTLDNNWTISPDQGSISPDGSLLAFAGPHGQGGGLYLKNRRTGEEKRIVNIPNDGNNFSNPIFSPDGNSVMFEEVNGTEAPFVLYTVGTDGSNLTQLIDKLAGPASYSPDGSKIMVEINVRPAKRINEKGERDYGKNYIELITANAANTPERLVEIQPGTPKFWSNNSVAIFYTGKDDGMLYEFNLDRKESQATPIKLGNVSEGDVAFHEALGKVPGADAIFVKNTDKSGAETVAILDLAGSSPNPELEKTAESIPTKDAQGHPLQTVKEMGAGQLLLTYCDQKPSELSGPKDSKLVVWGPDGE